MTDRGGQQYVVMTTDRGQAICYLSPTRQARKRRGLSGRQDRKWRVQQRRYGRTH